MVATPTETRRVAFVTLGCRLNQSETAVLIHRFESLGFSIVPFEAAADIVVVNTCTVTENGDSDVRQWVNKAGRLNPLVNVALIGCMAQVAQDRILQWPNVKWVVGSSQKYDLPTIILAHTAPVVIAPKISSESFRIPVFASDTLHTRVNLKIQDGCNFYCSFCVIPFARGPARSREFADIVSELAFMAERGIQEVVITGVNIGTYANSDRGISDVIQAVLDSGISRLRLSSIEPTTVPELVIDRMASSPQMCRHLHLPLQSGSDAVLQGMRRRYSRSEWITFVQQVAYRVKGVAIGTDVIVGFPGETDSDFDDTVSAISMPEVAYAHVFSYSNRPLARSPKREDRVSPHIIARRSQILREISRRKWQAFANQLCGRTVSVLFESKKNGLWRGLTDTYVRVRVAADAELTNQICSVKITGPWDGRALEGALA